MADALNPSPARPESQPAELAAIYVLLASPESREATGQMYGAVGGRRGPQRDSRSNR
jgi:hypothetical protein